MTTASWSSKQVEGLHRYQFGPFPNVAAIMAGARPRMHPFTCPNSGDGNHFYNGSHLGALIPTIGNYILDYHTDQGAGE